MQTMKLRTLRKGGEVTPQSVNSLRGWTHTRGPGEELCEAVRLITSALNDGQTVTIMVGGR